MSDEAKWMMIEFEDKGQKLRRHLHETEDGYICTILELKGVPRIETVITGPDAYRNDFKLVLHKPNSFDDEVIKKDVEKYKKRCITHIADHRQVTESKRIEKYQARIEKLPEVQCSKLEQIAIDKDSSGYTQMEYKGHFHGFGVDFEESNVGVGSFSVAIVEIEGGKIITVPAEDIIFLDAK